MFSPESALFSTFYFDPSRFRRSSQLPRYVNVFACRSRSHISLPHFSFLLFTFVVTRKATHARLATVLEAIPNVGVSIARDLRSIGIKKPWDLIGRNPYSLYRMLCDRTRTRQDPCILDTFISAVRFMEGAPARPWWSYTAERKKKFANTSLPRRKIAALRRRNKLSAR
jgi:hypothetical protein